MRFTRPGGLEAGTSAPVDPTAVDVPIGDAMFDAGKRCDVLFVTVLLSLVLGGSSADADAADGKVTVTFANWATAEGTTKPAMDQVIANFEKAHPDIQIKSEAISFSEIARQLALRVRSGNPPDVAQLAGDDTFVLASTGKLEPLGTYIGKDLQARLKPDTTNGLQYQ